MALRRFPLAYEATLFKASGNRDEASPKSVWSERPELHRLSQFTRLAVIRTPSSKLLVMLAFLYT